MALRRLFYPQLRQFRLHRLLERADAKGVHDGVEGVVLAHRLARHIQKTLASALNITRIVQKYNLSDTYQTVRLDNPSTSWQTKNFPANKNNPADTGRGGQREAFTSTPCCTTLMFAKLWGAPKSICSDSRSCLMPSKNKSLCRRRPECCPPPTPNTRLC